MAEHLIFGYGSLMSASSRSKSGLSGKALPISIRGIQRSWTLAAPSMRLTALGAIRNQDSVCTGVLFSVAESELSNFDERELKWGYERIELDRTKIISPGYIPRGIIWAYITEKPSVPSEEAPIVQSYLDVVMSGCLEEYGEVFAKQFILTTEGWHYPWLNDRACPRYIRAESVVDERYIDEILEETIPIFFQCRQ